MILVFASVKMLISQLLDFSAFKWYPLTPSDHSWFHFVLCLLIFVVSFPHWLRIHQNHSILLLLFPLFFSLSSTVINIHSSQQSFPSRLSVITCLAAASLLGLCPFNLKFLLCCHKNCGKYALILVISIHSCTYRYLLFFVSCLWFCFVNLIRSWSILLILPINQSLLVCLALFILSIYLCFYLINPCIVFCFLIWGSFIFNFIPLFFFLENKWLQH